MTDLVDPGKDRRTFGWSGPAVERPGQKPFVCYFYFVGWWSVSLGVSMDLRSPNIEIHLPFVFLRVGRRSWAF